MWDKFQVHFCTVDSLCLNGEPTLLGWISIGVAALVIVSVTLGLLGRVLEEVMDGFRSAVGRLTRCR